MQPHPIFCKSLRELPQSVCSVWFSHLTILEWRQDFCKPRSEEEWKKQLILAKRIFQGREIVEGSFSWWIKSNDSYVEARCFDVLMMLKDQVLLSFIQDKNPRKSRYMIKLISRILGRSFQIEKQKVWPKNSIISNWDLLSGNRLPLVENVLIQIFKTCNRLHKSCNWLPEGIFRK